MNDARNTQALVARGEWPVGDGEMQERVRTFDWASTPLGPIEAWPSTLRDAVALMLPSGFPTIVLWGDDLVQIYNNQYRDVMGIKHPEGLGQPTRESWPEVWNINAPIYARVMAGETLTFEDALYPITRSGKLEDAWFTLSYSPMHADDGAVAGVLVTVFETTEQHRASSALSDSESRYRAFVNASADVVYRMSPDWSQMRALNGRGFIADTTEPSEDWRDIYLLPDDRGRVQEAVDRAIATRSMFSLEHRVIQADGSPGWIASRAVPIFDQRGEITEWLGTASDVTKKKVGEQKLRESEELQTFLLKLSDELRPLTGADEVERMATRLLGEHLQADRCFLSPVNEDGLGMYVREEYLRDGASSVLGDYTFAQFGDFVGPELHAGRILAVEDVSALTSLSDDERASYAATAIAAYLLIPLVRDGTLAAFLTINHRTPRKWSDADKAVARQTADRLWVARERARAEVALHKSEVLRGIALAGGRMGTWRWDLGAELIWGDAQFWALWGYPPTDDPRPLSAFNERMSPDSAADVAAVIASAIDAADQFDGPLEVVSGPTAGHWLRWQGRATDDAAMLYGVTFDITEQKRAEATLKESDRHQRLLLAELQHRVRNTLAVVRSIARRTAENSTSAADMLAHFQGRLDAFSRVQAALTRNPQGLVSFTSLIEDELVAHALKKGGQVHIDGPELMLEPRTAERFSLAIHELATNAVKHGALANEQGHIAINWTKERLNGSEELVFNWRESGVQIYDVEPKRRGFGMELLGSSLPYDLGAETSIALRPDGLQFELKLPMPEQRAQTPDRTGDPTHR